MMKNILKTFSALVLACAAFVAHADTQTVDGVTWTYVIKNGEASVGGGSAETPAVAKSTNGAIAIPATLGGCPVTAIGEYAFFECESISSVVMPESIRTIRSEAFGGCGGLTAITISSGVTTIESYVFLGAVNLKEIIVDPSNECYASNDGVLYDKELSKLVICPEGKRSIVILPTVREIGFRACCGCDFLTEVTVPKNVAIIGSEAFFACSSLTNIGVEAENQSFCSYAGLLCNKERTKVIACPEALQDVKIPTGVLELGNLLFWGCQLRSVQIPSSVTVIDYGAFYDCPQLTSVTIPANVKSIGDHAFAYCHSLKSIYYEGNAPEVGDSVYWETSAEMTCYAREGSVGWISRDTTELPDKWPVDDSDARTIVRWEGEPPLTHVVTFDLGKYGVRTGGGELSQRVVGGEAAIAPELVSTATNRVFVGWTADLSFVTEDMQVSALYRNLDVTVAPGLTSEFEIDCCGSIRAVIAGVSGTEWADFAFCEYMGANRESGEVATCFALTHPNIVDVEKTAAHDADDYACYELPRINMAYWGGWISWMDYPSEDAVADALFRASPQEVQGCSELPSVFSWVAEQHPEDFDAHVEMASGRSAYDINEFIVRHLKDGNALVELTTRDSSHGITCCGYAYDESLALEDGGYLTGLFIIDSDNDMYADGGGAAAPNRITFCPIEWDDEECAYRIANIWGLEWDYFSVDCALWAKGATIVPKTELPFELLLDGTAVVGFQGGIPDRLVIPDGITSIEESAFDADFSDVDGLVSVVVPEGVTNIATWAFWYAENLTQISLPASLEQIGEKAFKGCESLSKVYVSTGDVEHIRSLLESSGLDVSDITFVEGEMPSDVKPDGTYTEIVDGIEWTYIVRNGEASVGTGSWRGTAVPSLTTFGAIVIPSKLGGCPVVGINADAFWDCSLLTSVGIPEGVTYVDYEAFGWCRSLLEVTVPSSVVYIADEAFSGCSSLVSVTIQDGVMYIGDLVFSSCAALKRVTIPASVVEIGNSVFVGCSSMTDVVVDAENEHYSSPSGLLCDKAGTTLIRCPEGFCGEIAVPDGVAVISAGAFNGCRLLTSVKLPVGVKNIGDTAFYNCTNLVAVSMPNGVTNLGWRAFCGCASLVSVSLPDGLERIESQTFCDCSALYSVKIPESVTCIDEMAFESCRSLVSVAIPASVTEIGARAFSGCSALTDFDVSPANADYGVQNGLLYDKNSMMVVACAGGKKGEVVIPGEMVAIEEWAFEECAGLTSVVISEGVESVGETAFWSCVALSSVAIPHSVTHIGRMAFAWCKALQTVYVDSGDADRVKEMLVASEYDVSTLSFAEMSHTVTFDLGEHGVSTGGVALVQQIRDGGAATAPEVIADVGWKFVGWDRDFDKVIADITVTAVYEELPKWVETEVVDGVAWTFVVSGDEASAGGGSVRLTAVPTSHAGVITVPSSLGGYPLAALGKSAFENCKSVTSVILPEGIRRIDGGAFRACAGLQSLALPSTLQTVDMFAFYGCKALVEVTFPADLKTIGANAFRSCTSLSRVHFSGDVPQGLAMSGLIGSSTKIYYPQTYATGYEAIVPADQRGVLFGVLKTTLKGVVNGKDVDIPNTWATSDLDRRFGAGKSAKFAARYGRDLVLALFEKTGKFDGSGRQMTVMDDFVAGTDPTDESSSFQVDISVGVDGIPHVTWTPDLNENGQKAERVYRQMGASSPTGPWREIKDAETSGCQFFKVSVEMP